VGIGKSKKSSNISAGKKEATMKTKQNNWIAEVMDIKSKLGKTNPTPTTKLLHTLYQNMRCLCKEIFC
jgi:hypothetical protein